MSGYRSRGEGPHYTVAQKQGTNLSEHSQKYAVDEWRPRPLTNEDAAGALLRLHLRVHGRLLLGLLLGLLLRVLFGKMAADQTTAYCANHGVMSGVMTGDPADDRALDTTGRVGRSDGGERQRGAQEGKPGATCFHVSITRVWMGAEDVPARITSERQMMDDGSQYKRQAL
jgi:hypothetical protein